MPAPRRTNLATRLGNKPGGLPGREPAQTRTPPRSLREKETRVNKGTTRGCITVLLQGLVLLLLVVVAPPPLAAITFTMRGFSRSRSPPSRPLSRWGSPSRRTGESSSGSGTGSFGLSRMASSCPPRSWIFPARSTPIPIMDCWAWRWTRTLRPMALCTCSTRTRPGAIPTSTTPKTDHLSRVTADPNNPDVMLANSEVILLGTLDVPPCSQYPVGADCFPTDS